MPKGVPPTGNPPGRPPRYAEPLMVHNVRLTRSHLQYAKEIGGAVSEGVRLALEYHAKRHNKPLPRSATQC